MSCLVSLVFMVFFFLAVHHSTAREGPSTGNWRNTIQMVNNEGPHLGLITTFAAEDDAFFAITSSSFRPHRIYPFVDLSGRRFHIGKILERKVVYVSCGTGMINAAAATQQMLDMFDIIGIIHFGIARNVNSSMSIGDVTIPAEFANTGLWDWLKPDSTVPANDVSQLDIGSYNIQAGGQNLLGLIGYTPEQFYEAKKPNTVQDVFWFQTDKNWLHMASNLTGLKLEKCVNPRLCLSHDPKVVVGLKGSTSDFYVDNAAYQIFLDENFQVSSADMESVAVVMTSLSNGFPVIVIRALSELAGAEDGGNLVRTFGSVAVRNAVKVVTHFIKLLPVNGSSNSYA